MHSEGILASKNGEPQRFIVEVLAIPGTTHDTPLFTVRMLERGGNSGFYAKARTHDKATVIFDKVMEAAMETLKREAMEE